MSDGTRVQDTHIGWFIWTHHLMTVRHELAADPVDLTGIQSTPQRFNPDSQKNTLYL